MTSFSEQHAPPHAPAGAEIPTGVRRALLSWFADREVDDAPPEPPEIWRLLCQRIGYGEPQDVVDDVQARFGHDAAARVAEAFSQEMAVRRSVPRTDQNRYALPALDSIPSALFLDALEIAIDLLRERPRVQHGAYDDFIVEYYNEAAVAEINRLFAVRGISYRFRDDGTAEWHGDEGAYQQVIAPALAALEDPRLAGAAQEYGDALVALRQGTRTGEKNAIRDASNAVESAMKSVLDAHSVPRVGNETADLLWDLLMNAGIAAAKTKDTICAAPRIRNTYGGHGPNPSPDPVPDGVPEVAAQTAAAALVYLAQLLP